MVGCGMFQALSLGIEINKTANINVKNGVYNMLSRMLLTV